MRETNRIVRHMIPGTLFLFVWLIWLLINGVPSERAWPALADLSSLSQVAKLDGAALAILLGGITLPLGFVIAQVYWALYWSIPKPLPFLRRFLPVVDYLDILREVKKRLGCRWIPPLLSEELDESLCLANKGRASAWDALVFLWFRFSCRNRSWKGLEFRNQTLHDAYHSLGASMVAVILALATLLIAVAIGRLRGQASHLVVSIVDVFSVVILYCALWTARTHVVKHIQNFLKDSLTMLFRES